jgi:uncharacterized protein YaiI (UPF0178 family)
VSDEGGARDRGGPPAPTVYVDADACPVKDEVYRVAARYGLPVVVASNRPLRLPPEPGIRLEVVPGSFDAVDDWIAGVVVPGDVVVTGDIPLAARCLAGGARVLGPRGREFTEDAIGDALATRALLAHLRETGTVTGGPAAFGKRERSEFLQALDRLLQAAARGR